MIGVGILLSFTVSVFNFFAVVKKLKKLAWKVHLWEFQETWMLQIHSSSGPLTSSSAATGVVMWPVPVATMIWPTCQQSNVATGMVTSSTCCYCEFEVLHTMIKASFRIGRRWRLYKPERWFSSHQQPTLFLYILSLSSSDQQWLPTTTTNTSRTL
jgi:hypothetical protein